MGHKPLELRLQELARKRENLDVELARLEGRQRLLAKKADDRRKILLGAWLLYQIERQDPVADRLRQELPGFLTRPGDKQLFANLLGLSETS